MLISNSHNHISCISAQYNTINKVTTKTNSTTNMLHGVTQVFVSSLHELIQSVS